MFWCKQSRLLDIFSDLYKFGIEPLLSVLCSCKYNLCIQLLSCLASACTFALCFAIALRSFALDLFCLRAQYNVSDSLGPDMFYVGVISATAACVCGRVCGLLFPPFLTCRHLFSLACCIVHTHIDVTEHCYRWGLIGGCLTVRSEWSLSHFTNSSKTSMCLSRCWRSCMLLQTYGPDVWSHWQWQNDIAFHTGVFITSLCSFCLFACSCCFTMVLLLRLPLSFFFLYTLYVLPLGSIFLSVTAFVVPFMYIFYFSFNSVRFCCEKLAKQRVHVPLYVLFFRHSRAIMLCGSFIQVLSDNIPLALFASVSLFVRAMVPKMVARKQSSMGRHAF